MAATSGDVNRVERTYVVGKSAPNFFDGICPACKASVGLDITALFSDDSLTQCGTCGANTPRRQLILEALALIDPVTWSFLCSDVYIGDNGQISQGQIFSYSVTETVAKWQHQEVRPNAISGQRYLPALQFYDEYRWGFLSVFDATPSQPPATPPPAIDFLWYRFALSEQGAVPAWRQSLFGAATLLTTHPSAAIVLVAAEFEAFFTETMRIAWREKQLDPGAFDRLARRNLPISTLVEWLPAAVQRPALRDVSPSLHGRWDQLVNRRRNAVVHEANVHFNSEQAQQSMRAALECITAIDPAALIRPHAYYVNV